MNVLIGVDGTEKSRVATAFVSRLLRPGHDTVRVYFAPPARPWMSLLQRAPTRSAAPMEAFAEQVTASALELIPAGFDKAASVDRAGVAPASGLLQAAQLLASNLIVVGAGRSSSRLRFFVGGVTRAVLHEARQSVLACRQTARIAGPLKVLLAVDVAESWQPMVSLLTQLQWPPESEGRILHVMDYVEDERLRRWLQDTAADVSTEWHAAYEQQLRGDRERASELLSELQQQLGPVFARHEPAIVQGHVVEQIVQVVEAEQIDLVVVGGGRNNRLIRLLGSTTEGLLLQAPASVLAIHGTEGR